MSFIPHNWIQCSLNDVADILNGYAFPSRDYRQKGIPLIRQSNLAGKRVTLDKCVFLDPEYLRRKKEYSLKKNDILIGMSGSIGKLCIYDLETPALQNQRTGKIVMPSFDVIDWKFVWYYLNTVERQLKEKGKGLGISNVSSK